MSHDAESLLEVDRDRRGSGGGRPASAGRGDPVPHEGTALVLGHGIDRPHPDRGHGLIYHRIEVERLRSQDARREARSRELERADAPRSRSAGVGPRRAGSRRRRLRKPAVPPRSHGAVAQSRHDVDCGDSAGVADHDVDRRRSGPRSFAFGRRWVSFEKRRSTPPRASLDRRFAGRRTRALANRARLHSRCDGTGARSASPPRTRAVSGDGVPVATSLEDRRSVRRPRIAPPSDTGRGRRPGRATPSLRRKR